MKFLQLCFFFLLISLVCSKCTKYKDCKEKDAPVCVNEECVECEENEHCSVDKYCTTNNKCKKYSEDEILGEDCRRLAPTTCDSDEDNMVCGYCEKDSDEVKSYAWVGECINKKCVPCGHAFSSFGDQYIENQHSGGTCYPSSLGSSKGSFSKTQISTLTIGSYLQDSGQIAITFICLLLFAILIISCFRVKNSML